ncbi:MAG: DUF2007 domain-containing protein [Nitrospirota bacterium]|nr:DUF2007 domain-containing protein [Nitrospirota bacterium]
MTDADVRQNPTPRVVVATFFDPVQAEMCASFLLAEGFDVRLRDNHTVSIDPLYAMALGGVRLTAPEHEADRVRQVLDAFHGEAGGDGTSPAGGTAENASDPGRVCRICGNRPVVAESGWRLLGIPLPFGPTCLRCVTCGYRWAGP